MLIDDRMTLASLRVRAGYIQHEAAALLGVSTTTLAKWEHDSRSIPMLHIEKVSHLYQVPPSVGVYIGKQSDLSDDIRAAYTDHVERTRTKVDVSQA